MPKLVIIMGGVCAGKTTIRKQKFSKRYINIDAGDIFWNLCNDEYVKFPSIYKKEMEKIGQNLATEAIINNNNIVLEIIGDKQDEMYSLIDKIKLIGYTVKLVGITCDIETAIERDRLRDINNISAFFTQDYNMKWLIKAIDRVNKKGTKRILAK